MSDVDPRAPIAFQGQRSRAPIGDRSAYYEHAARMQKAAKLTSHLQERGITADHLQVMHPSLLAHHAAMAGVSDPSTETWDMVGKSMRSSEAEKAKAKQPGYDPFAGL